MPLLHGPSLCAWSSVNAGADGRRTRHGHLSLQQQRGRRLSVTAGPGERQRRVLAGRRGSGRRQAPRRLSQPRQSRAADGAGRPSAPTTCAPLAMSRFRGSFGQTPDFAIRRSSRIASGDWCVRSPSARAVSRAAHSDCCGASGSRGCGWWGWSGAVAWIVALDGSGPPTRGWAPAGSAQAPGVLPGGRLPAANMRKVLMRPSATSTIEMVRSLFSPAGVSCLGGG